MLKRLINWIGTGLGMDLEAPALRRQLSTLQVQHLASKIEVRKVKAENRRLAKENERLEDEAASAWEMLEEIKTAENFLAGSPKAIQDTLENIEDQLLIEMLQKTKTPYGEA